MKKIFKVTIIILIGVFIGFFVTLLVFKYTTVKIYQDQLMMQDLVYIRAMMEIKNGNGKTVLEFFQKRLDQNGQYKNGLLDNQQNATIQDEIHKFLDIQTESKF